MTTPKSDLNKMGGIITGLLYFGVPLVLLLSSYKFFKSSKQSRHSLKGKVVLITGANSGLGEALAHAFYRCGCKVVLAARRENELVRVKKDLLAKQLNIQTHEPIILCLDLSEIESLPGKVQDVYKVCGHIDILINNGGISNRGNILDTSMEVQKRLMYVNHFGPAALTEAVLPKMVERKTGCILFVSTVQGRIAIPERSAYGASKHACQAYADTLRAEMAKYGITVSVISPAYIQTSLSLNALSPTGEKHGVMDTTTASGYKPEFVADKVLDMVLSRTEELVLAPLSHRMAIILRVLAPTVYFWIMRKRAK